MTKSNNNKDQVMVHIDRDLHRQLLEVKDQNEWKLYGILNSIIRKYLDELNKKE